MIIKNRTEGPITILEDKVIEAAGQDSNFLFCVEAMFYHINYSRKKTIYDERVSKLVENLITPMSPDLMIIGTK